MLFSSIVFLFYFLPVVILLYYLFHFSRALQNGLLLVFSLLFYAWGEPAYVFLMLGSIGFNYLCGLAIDKENKKADGNSKGFLVLAIIGNVGTLFVFKYLGFVVENINTGLPAARELPVPQILLPIGISFFTFQALSYVIDVFSNSVKVQKNPFSLGLYISFFPQLIAGPIVRYETINEQITGRKETVTKISVGACRFIVGLSKKVLVSNSMAVMADRIFSLQLTGPIDVCLAWIGAIAYTFQIYYDFSGYSDMAIGLGLIFGFRFEENFNYPYISKSISEFWRRWHISLGTWFKDYVYFPMGGSRVKNKDKMVRNLFVVWLLTGIWHGAEWTFLFWGLFNFVFIFLEKLFGFEESKIRKWIKHVYCMFLVILGWVLFRSNDLLQAGGYYKALFGFGGGGIISSYAVMFLREFGLVLAVAIFFSMPFAPRTGRYIMEEKRGFMVFETAYPVVMVGLFLLCVCYLVKGTYNPFIYFNF